MKSIPLAAIVMATLFATGCGDEQNRSVVDLGDKEAIASYEEAIRDAERAMEASEATPAPEVTPND
ncbi:hypothetical protein [Rhodopirellula sallentina]|uniref:Secreted protein n=1 Tax=Rhodopirellula sallentina SM41 TaxID=1263870 RepID=M5UQJ8_9BACT|nr:hypothetical protein [Rhodopirellula sallentina]EMI58253.1 secreted protein [Rhodopirellula sallentina SM41]